MEVRGTIFVKTGRNDEFWVVITWNVVWRKQKTIERTIKNDETGRLLDSVKKLESCAALPQACVKTLQLRIGCANNNKRRLGHEESDGGIEKKGSLKVSVRSNEIPIVTID
jgi:hypothetical protein